MLLLGDSISSRHDVEIGIVRIYWSSSRCAFSLRVCVCVCGVHVE
jgi:hypothetical protein